MANAARAHACAPEVSDGDGMAQLSAQTTTAMGEYELQRLARIRENECARLQPWPRAAHVFRFWHADISACGEGACATALHMTFSPAAAHPVAGAC